ncbi:MAG: hypothetical protein JNG89_16015 [Planctomycetaceae bacterium]|nr:hypothetical protein [Planctomycetaceae bacterium]
MHTNVRWAIAVVLAGCCCGCRPSAPANEYQQLVETLKSSEDRLNAVGKIERKTYPPGSAWSIDLHGATIDDQIIQDIVSLDLVSELLLGGATITDAQLQTLLTSDRTGYLNVLDISKTAITDAGVAGVADKKYLQTLNVQGSQVSEAFAAKLNSDRQGNNDIPAMFKVVAVAK